MALSIFLISLSAIFTALTVYANIIINPRAVLSERAALTESKTAVSLIRVNGGSLEESLREAINLIGEILFRDSRIVKAISKRIPYLAGGEAEQATITGSRPGASAIAVWALLKHLGKEGYKAIVEGCMKLTWKLADEVSRIDGLKLVTKPVINIVGIKSDAEDIRLIVQELRRRRWAVSHFDDYMRIVIMPHTKPSHITSFLNDLRNIIRDLVIKGG